MSYRGAPYPTSYGGQPAMPMPSIPTTNQQQHPYKPSYQPPTNGYPRNMTPYPGSNNPPYPGATSHNMSHNAPYPGAMSQVTSPTASEIDEGMKQLTDDLITGVIKSAQNADLEVLISNDEKIMELISDSQITKDLNQKRKEMADFNNDQAAENISLKPELEVLQTTLRELSQKQNELRDRYLNLQNKLGNSLSSDTILSLIQVATGEQETLSEDIKMSFYDGELLIDDFIKNFVDGRKLYQLRKIKSEKLNAMLQHGQRAAHHNMRPGVPSVPRPPVPAMPGYIGNQPIRYGAQYSSYPR